MHLNDKKVRMAGNMIMYKYKNILQAQQISKKFYISDKRR